MSKFRYIKLMLPAKRLKRHEEVTLLNIVKDEYLCEEERSEAMDKLLLNFIALAASIVNRYLHLTSLSPDELLSEAIIGVYEGIELFERDRIDDVKISSYICFSIKKRIIDAIRGNYNVRYPSTFWRHRSIINKEIKKRLDRNIEFDIIEIMESLEIPLIEQERYMMSRAKEVSLSMPVNGVDGLTYEESIPDKSFDEMEKRFDSEDILYMIKVVLNDDELFDILVRTEGLAGYPKQTNQALSVVYGKSDEWIRRKRNLAKSIIRQSNMFSDFI